MNTDPRPSPSFGLVLVRVAAGLVMLAAGWEKVANGFGAASVSAGAERWAAAPAPLAAFGQNVVLVHPQVFGILGSWGELVLGVLLFLGFLTRPTGVLTALLYTAAWVVVDGPARVLALLLVAVGLGCAISRAGHSAGADVLLAPKLPGWLTWTRSV